MLRATSQECERKMGGQREEEREEREERRDPVVINMSSVVQRYKRELSRTETMFSRSGSGFGFESNTREKPPKKSQGI